MKWLLLVAFVAYTFAAVVKHELHRIESNRIQLIKSGLWEKHLQAKQLRRSINNKEVIHNEFLDLDDVEYVSNITMGTPCNQKFTIVLDTATSTFWLPDSSCYVQPCTTRNLYYSNKSSSYVKDGREFKATYIDGSVIFAFFGQDTVCIGGLGEQQLIVPNQLFGQAHALSGFSVPHVDGILGLAFAALNEHQVAPPLVNAVQQGLLDEPIFTVHLRHNGYKEFVYGGRITFGGLDTDNCGDVIAYQPLSSATYWQFRISSISARSYVNDVPADVITDTGYARLAGPAAVVEGLAVALGGVYEPYKYEWYIKCIRLPGPISIVIGSNTYNIDEVNFIEDVGDPTYCLLGLLGVSMAGYGPQWILGDPFIRSYCHIHDIANQRIGFAKSKQA